MMLAVVLFIVVLAVLAAWLLRHQGLGEKPWLNEGPSRPGSGVVFATASPTKIGLGLFIAVAGSLFALLVSAYAIRMQMADWWALPVPRLLWFNTAVLVLSSGALEGAKHLSRHDDEGGPLTLLLLSGFLALVFVTGQVLAWRQLFDEGYGLAANPANSFFYLATGLHGLHVLGGLVGLERAAAWAWRGGRGNGAAATGRIELCAIYWHFLLAVWLVLLALLAGWAGDFLVICRQLLT
jgi:cytochrome c oxidase subunit 3